MTEAARALRAIFLNIVGDTKTEIDEGVTWTTGEIEGLRDVIKLYAKDAWDAAQASGGIIDPMKAIEGLSKSIKDGVLTEAQLMEMVSDIGGKLRTSQLLAIVNNWDMYESMLETYRNAYGSADKEIENAMDSWSRKTEVLKNKWTEFVKTGLNSKAFKGALDILIAFVERLGTLPGLLTRLIPLFAALKLREMAKNMDSAAKAAENMADGMQKAGTAASTLNWISIVLMAISAAWNAISYAVEDAKIKHQEMVQKTYEEADAAKESADKVFELSSQMEQATANSDEFKSAAQELADTLGVDLPGGVDTAISKLKEYRAEALALDAAKANTAALNAKDEFLASVGGAYKLDIGDTSAGGWNDILAAQAPELATQVQDILSGYTAGTDYGTLENAKEYRDAVSQIVDAIDLYVFSTGKAEIQNTEYYTTLRQFLADTESAYSDMEEKEKQAFDTKALYDFMMEAEKVTVNTTKDLNDFIGSIINSEQYTSEEKDALIALANEYYGFNKVVEETTDTVEENTDAVEKETDALFANQKALDENATASERAAAAKKDAEAAAAKFCDALFDENGELTANAKAALVASDYLADLTQAELNARLEAAKANYASLRAQLAAVSTEALKAAYAMMAYMEAAQDGQLDPEAWKARRTGGYAYSLMSQIQALEKEINSINVQASSVAPYTSSYSASTGGGSHSGGSGHSGGSSSSSTEDKKLTALQDRVKLLKSELSLMKERGDSEEDQISKIREIQDALKNEYQYLESIKGDQTTINNLYQEWYSYANQITDLEKQAADEAQRQADAIQAAVEAQKALDNILKNRSVRVYNAATGQWEWQSDPAAVASAQAELNSAISNAGYSQDAWPYIYSMISSLASFKDNWTTPGPGAFSNVFGGNSYGNTYNFGSIRLSEAQAQNMTVKQFVDLANALPAFNNSP